MGKALFPIALVLMLLASILFTGPAIAATKDNFTLTVLRDGGPVREFNGEVAVPFYSEYKLRLINNNRRRCSATVYLDGAKVSEMGNFVIGPTDYLDLERFLNDSLTEGKRFKFVPLNHPDVEDPNRVENGIIKVEFRLERLREIMPMKYWKEYWPDNGLFIIQGDIDANMSIPFDAAFLTDANSSLFINDGLSSTSTLCSNTSAGATIPGSHSDQAFYKVNYDFENEVTTISLKMVGIKGG